MGNKVGNKVERVELTDNRKKIISEIRNNPNIAKEQLLIILGISTTIIDKNLNSLKEQNYIKRVGSKKTSYWKVIKNELV